MAFEPSKHVNGRMWPPGVSGNPNGRPVGSRTVFSQSFLKDLASVWAERGRAAMEKTAIDQPGVFFATCARLIGPEVKLSVLTYIDKFDKRVEGFRGHYDMLSERCHPNSLGHNFMFSKLDRTDGTVRFCDEREPARNGQMILAALAPLPLAESISARLDELIEKVSDLHHRVAPVGGPVEHRPA